MMTTPVELSHTWVKTTAARWERSDGVAIVRNSASTYLVLNGSGHIACRASVHGGYSRTIAFASTLAGAKEIAVEVGATAPAFHSLHCDDGCEGHTRTVGSRLVK